MPKTAIHPGPNDAPAHWNSVSEAVIGAAMAVHSALGPGLPERLYEEAMAHELQLRRLRVSRQCQVRLPYKDVLLSPLILDLVVEELVIVELKAVESVHEVHLAQLMGYLRASRMPLGLLLNFNVIHMRDGIHRRILSSSTPIPHALVAALPHQPPAP